jgi:hypothetical protein
MLARHALELLPGTPVTRSTSSGVHLATSSLMYSMPQTRREMKSLSSQPFSKMCQSIPQISATSVPGRNRTYSDVGSRAGEARVDTMSGVVLFLGRSTCSSDTG